MRGYQLARARCRFAPVEHLRIPYADLCRLVVGKHQNVWGQATTATPIRAGFTGSITKNGGGLPLPEQIHTPRILILPPCCAPYRTRPPIASAAGL